MSHFSGHFEGASTFLTPKLSRARFSHQKKIISRSFLNSGTLIVIKSYILLCREACQETRAQCSSSRTQGETCQRSLHLSHFSVETHFFKQNIFSILSSYSCKLSNLLLLHPVKLISLLILIYFNFNPKQSPRRF